jgi:hypothetical protein
MANDELPAFGDAEGWKQYAELQLFVCLDIYKHAIQSSNFHGIDLRDLRKQAADWAAIYTACKGVLDERRIEELTSES